MLTIIPTRGRNESAKEFTRLFRENSVISDLVFGLDEDDHEKYERLDGVRYDVNPRLRVNGTLNLLANKYCHDYEYLAFMGDDQRLRTKGWDLIFYESIKPIPLAIAYGDDLIQGARLPTSVAMDARIVRILGYMAPPCLTHMYIDNFWLDVGKAIKTLCYFPKVTIEHMHFSKGKSEMDATYKESNNALQYKADLSAYMNYLEKDFGNDVAKLKAWLSDYELKSIS
jgi:hypothetical protein